MSGQAIITIRDKQWQISIADTPWELTQGMGGVPEIASGTGMFSDTGLTQIIQVTTIPMLFPVDIAFLSETLVVTEVYRNIEPGYIVTSTSPARYFLEVNAGELEGIDSGDQAFVELLPAPAWLPEIPWETVIAVVMGSLVLFTFIVTIIRSIECALTPPKKSRLHGSRGERLLPMTEKKLWYLGEWWEKEYSVADAVVYRSADRKKRLYVYWDGTKEIKPAPADEELRKTRVYGAWLWLVPYDIRKTPPETIPARGWRLIESRPGRFRTLNEVRDMAPPATVGGTFILAIGKGDHFEWELIEHSKSSSSKPPAVIPIEPRPRRPREELEFWPDSPEVIAQTIDAIGYRQQIDTAFLEAIKRAKGLI